MVAGVWAATHPSLFQRYRSFNYTMWVRFPMIDDTVKEKKTNSVTVKAEKQKKLQKERQLKKVGALLYSIYKK